MKPHSLLTLSLLLLPSALLLFRNSDLPHFGDVHDDSIYFVSAKSMAEGSYNIQSLPGEPAQTKYPPLYPLLLSVAWRLQPRFPANLPIAAWLSWLAVPFILVQLAALYPKLGLSSGRTWLLLTVFAANPYLLLFSTTLLSELWFTALVLTSLLLMEEAAETRAPASWAVAAGVAAGLAYLTRSAGIVLLASGAVYLWRQRGRHSALLMAGSMLPFVLGWTLWSKLNQFHTDDANLLYYVDYFGYRSASYAWTDVPLLLWKNTDELLYGLGGLVLPKVVQSLALKIAAEVVAVGMISGVVRLVRRGLGLNYPLFAGLSMALLVVWHFPPNERYVLPIFPLALAGLLTEVEHLQNLLKAGWRHRDRSQRIAAAVMTTAGGALLAAALLFQLNVDTSYLPQFIQQHRVENVNHRGVYAWVRAKLPGDAVILAYNDPLMFLFSGHHAMSRILTPSLWYRDDHASIVGLYRDIVPWAREHGISYIYFSSADLKRDWTDEDRAAAEKAMESNPGLTPVYKRGISTVYQVH